LIYRRDLQQAEVLLQIVMLLAKALEADRLVQELS
jgi:hypothetical protein